MRWKEGQEVLDIYHVHNPLVEGMEESAFNNKITPASQQGFDIARKLRYFSKRHDFSYMPSQTPSVHVRRCKAKSGHGNKLSSQSET